MVVKLPKLEIWQRDVFDYYVDNPKGKWFVTKVGRQRGKSVLAQILLIYASLSQENSVSICVSPVLMQSRKMYEDINRMAKDLITKANGSTLELTFINGSKILFKSGEQGDTIRGNTVSGSGIAVCDEAAYLKDDLFFSIIVPTTTVYNAPIFCFSTPRYKQGFFYSLYMQGLTDNEKVHSFDWNNYDTSKYLPDETKEIYKQQMPRNSFISEVLGEFIDGDSTIFTDFKSSILNKELDCSLPVVISIDWSSGVGSDYTVLTFMQLQSDNIIVSRQLSFNNKTGNQTIDIILKEVKSLSDKSVPEISIIVEKNSIGQIFFDLLNDRLDEINEYKSHYNSTDITASAFITTNKSKDRSIKKLQVLFEKSKICIPNDIALISELSAYECKINSNGTPTYNAPAGQHDDRVMSLLIGIDRIYNELN